MPPHGPVSADGTAGQLARQVIAELTEVKLVLRPTQVPDFVSRWRNDGGRGGRRMTSLPRGAKLKAKR